MNRASWSLYTSNRKGFSKDGFCIETYVRQM